VGPPNTPSEEILRGIFVFLARKGAEAQRINSFASLRLCVHYYFLNIYSHKDLPRRTNAKLNTLGAFVAL
jgi:hypothetical protein